jgi:hypothetical protein
MMDSPQPLVDILILLFPEFIKEWDNGASFGHRENYTYHSVLQEFAPVSLKMLSNATTSQIKDFCNLLNRMVEIGGDHENAVSTCFLEHASQVGVRKIIAPYLSKEAKRELR